MPIIIQMDKQLNFEDNIFILNVRIRMLEDTLRLNTDPAVFLKKTADDILFVDYALGALLENLSANRRFIDREEELDKLADLEWQFDRLLDKTRGHFPEHAEHFARCKNTSADRRRQIGEVRSPNEQAVSEPVVSSSELSELLRAL